MSTYDVMASSMNWSDTAAVRVTGAALSAGFAAVGLVQTADTGQVNWASVSAPMGGNLTNCDAQSRAGAGIMLWWAD